jgi:HD-like signal output (HDOD) protein/CheY-like chemotaxis protein
MVEPVRPTILLVDDEPNILSALRRLLRKERLQILTAGSGEEGLALLPDHHVDLALVDMRMPGMDGATFLHQIRHQYPATIRVILTGYAERDTLARAFADADIHQIIAKPWDDPELRAVIRDSLTQRVRCATAAAGAASLMGSLGPLPSLPAVYCELRELVQQPEPPSRDAVAQVIMRDPAMAAQVMRIANSSIFGQRRRVETVSRAVFVLGLRLIETLTLSAGAFKVLQSDDTGPLRYEALRQHSLACGVVARDLAGATGQASEELELVTLTGLLHDLGQLALAKFLPQRYSAVAGRARLEQLPLHLVEAQDLGTTHAAVGGHVADWWGLPEIIGDAIRAHCVPSAGRIGVRLAAYTHLADRLVHRMGMTTGVSVITPPSDPRSLELTGLTEQSLETRYVELQHRAAEGTLLTP